MRKILSFLLMLLVISPVVPFAKESKNNSKILQEKTHKHKVSKKSKKRSWLKGKRLGQRRT